jgi:hypothetical protein
MYDKEYLQKFTELEKTETNTAIQQYRVGLVRRTVPDYACTLIDIGCAAGSFLANARSSNLSWDLVGMDVNPYAVGATVHRGIMAFSPEVFDTVYRYNPFNTCMTFFDSLEHLQDPRKFLGKYKPRWIVCSLPSLDGFHEKMPGRPIELWKHYRPLEHLWNFTSDTFVEFMLSIGYMLVIGPEWTESQLRRDPVLGSRNIMSFAFSRVEV